MKFNLSNILLATALSTAVMATSSHAEIILHGTRVIYPSDAREVTLQLSNNGTKPSLVQAWIDEGDPQSTPDQSKVPFMISPPIARVEAERSQTLRITALPQAAQFNKNQETVLWLNVVDIPPKPSTDGAADAPENFLQLAIRSRIKFFYRPASIKEDVRTAPEQLQWSRSGNTLNVKNPTPFHVTLTTIRQKKGDKQVDLLPQGLMLKPFSTEEVALQSNTVEDMSFININDYGGRVEYKIKLQ
ncbi:fimbrial biogenesis chaperone [Acinetobacter rudis]|uniref:Fimbria/pilus periplasmic chaperone n=1 Tax=Acinetobacter rudis TaxID=632955 RepID=A0AAW8J761_9GAMM|nr:fimbria/pilus periplasmic chaperone [Acinetobacter rudis]MDQ8935287.1 fimbria/pilus periplasmic chaperone [Acinetobacter rudis]MDQ9017518.1 fimbria/pilus periplasmic chaperone [Acinetobacter rudis]